jgi:putative ABC transport system permease protein
MKIAFRALRVNKLRSALTMLGIIIGVGAVIAMVAVGSGATARIQQQIASIGSNVIIVMSGSVTSGGTRMGFGQGQTLTEDDARAIAQEPAVAAAAPSSRGGGQLVYGNNNWATSIQGTTPEYFSIRDMTIPERPGVHAAGCGRGDEGRRCWARRWSTICSTATIRWARSSA